MKGRERKTSFFLSKSMQSKKSLYSRAHASLLLPSFSFSLPSPLPHSFSHSQPLLGELQIFPPLVLSPLVFLSEVPSVTYGKKEKGKKKKKKKKGEGMKWNRQLYKLVRLRKGTVKIRKEEGEGQFHTQLIPSISLSFHYESEVFNRNIDIVAHVIIEVIAYLFVYFFSKSAYTLCYFYRTSNL